MSDQIVIQVEHPQIAAGIKVTVSASMAHSGQAAHIAREITDQLDAWAGGPPREEPRAPGPQSFVCNRHGVELPYNIYARTLGGPRGRGTGRTTRMLHKVLATDPRGGGNQDVIVVAKNYQQARWMADRLMEMDTDDVLFRQRPHVIYRGDQRIEFVSSEYPGPSRAKLVFWDHAVQEVR